ncbi:acyl CoA:acetate/3-ketoacid CoA transferase [Caldifermentibacillus hisashii]|jgi:acetate CoA-transferase|uniref:acyl CoA:acetate/3-ketoacid CoA transferase n=1 Tax=Caldifermentibacillus hisashii TaxID=996558 RepID=UPI0031FC836F
MTLRTRKGGKVPILTPEAAVKLIPNEATVAICGAGGGLNEPTLILEELARQYKENQRPKDITLYHTSGIGDRATRGLSLLAQKGLVKRVIGGHWGQSPKLAEMAERNEIEAYNFPQGVMSQLLRATAAGQPGLITHVGLGTFIDPRQQGGKLNEKTKEDLVKLIDIGGKEYLFYPSIYPDVTIIRGTTADTEGYITMEDEVAFMDALPMAQAAYNNGGIVIVQVQKLVKSQSLHPRAVKIPGYLIDAVIVNPNQTQLYTGTVDRFVSGDYVMEIEDVDPMPLTERKVIARRALAEVKPGDIGNVGVGISDGIGVVAGEEGVADDITLTVELGPIGGVSAQGIYFGATVNMKALLDMPAQFDFYHGGGLDVSFLSFAEFDQYGNVNVHHFNGKIVGTGGFIDIAQNSKKVIFSGTFTAGGLKTSINEGKLSVLQEGKFQKLVNEVSGITFNGRDAIKNGQEVLYITERAVFKLTLDGLELIEIAPGMDLEKDILAHMGFRPIISPQLKEMDPKLFQDGNMGIKSEWEKIKNEQNVVTVK